MRAFRDLLSLGTAVGVSLGLLLVEPAAAGGSWLRPLQDRYEPGDPAALEGSFSRGQLGWIEDGPFFAYLRVDPVAVETAAPEAWPYIDPSDLPLGHLQIQEGGEWGQVAIVEFIVPDVPPGLYDVVYCNDPCTDGIGDLIGGTISIGQDPPYPLSAASIAAAPKEDDQVPESGISAVMGGDNVASAPAVGVVPEQAGTPGAKPASVAGSTDRSRPWLTYGAGGAAGMAALLASLAYRRRIQRVTRWSGQPSPRRSPPRGVEKSNA